MHIIHGTWIPDDTDAFAQEGAFYLWVETDAPIGTARKRAEAVHPRHLTQAALAAFLIEKLGVRELMPGTLARTLSLQRVLLPTADGAPLPSFELLRYVDEEAPAEWALAPWTVWCYRVPDVIAALNDIHFIALHAAEDFQLGADLLFWQQYTQALKGIIAADQYIPALTYRALPSRGGKRAKNAPAFELYPGWELLAETYEATLARYVAAMPAVCRAGLNGHDDTQLFAAEPLLRHFSECLLYNIVVGTPFTAKFDQQVAGTLLYRCLYPYRPDQPQAPAEALDDYKHWLAWRAGLTAAHTDAGFTLCFRLEEAPSTDVDNWRLHFLVAAKHDPSLKLELAEYWALRPKARAAAARPFGQNFEKNLLLALGYAARIYPTVWDGLATDQPSGLRLTLDDAFAFLKESAWVLEDAGYTVIVPAWWTPEGRRRAKIRLKTAAQPAKGASTPGAGHLSLDTLVAYEYQLAIGGQAVTEEEWRQLVEAKTPLVQFRGQWMELDRDKMQQMLQFWQTHQHEAPEMTLLDVIKLGTEAEDDLEWEHDQALQDMLARLHDKSAFAPIDAPAALQGTLRDYQKRGVAWLQYLETLGLNPCLADDMGLGKCLSPDALVAVNGSLESAASLWDRYATEVEYDGEGYWSRPSMPLLVPSLSHKTCKMTLAPVRRLYRQYVREKLRTVTLEDGSSTTMTRQHHLLTSNGWTDNLHVGDYVCVPATVPWNGDEQDPDLVMLLAWQIAEGHELNREARVTITQKDVATLENLSLAFERIGQRYDLKINHPTIHPTKACPDLTVHSRDYQRFLEARGYEWGKRSKDKTIPPFILRANLPSVRTFLRNYFDAEGSVSRSMRSIEISTASPLLIQQLSFLLRRFGIWLRVSRKQKRATNGSGIFRSYYYGVIGGNGARHFLREIGFATPRKQRLLEEICAYAVNTNIEGVPASTAVARLVQETGLPVRHFGMHNTIYTNGSQQFSRTSVRRVVDGCDKIISGRAEQEYRQLKRSRWTARTLERYARLDMKQVVAAKERIERLLTQEVFYCRIKTIEEFDYEGWVYDFEVAEHHNFVANSMLCHNTVEVIAHLLGEREDAESLPPTLVIAPTSVLGNWRKEIERFAPDLRTLVHQGSTRTKEERGFKEACQGHDVVVTSFALARLDEKLLRSVTWRRVVVDEAQNIKNPQAAQTRAILKLAATHRLALTGTPVENRLRDLWSIFNFLNPGYLGKEAQFRKSFEAPIYKDNDLARSATLKKLVEPFILRRVKTDKRIIDDLPDKIEQKMYCTLTPEQASLYEAVVKDVTEQLEEAEGIQRKGLILSTLLRLKQICNHPAQFLQDGSAFTAERSHKLQRLGEMVEEVIESGESALVFTQFTEIGDALERYLAHTKHYNTYYLHGGTSAVRRDRMVAEFQDAATEPSVFILSLRAGGVGLNLTKANHVFHFDRWWNPAVEDQATDRAFRIGQRKNVFAHKFVAMGTMEERIDAMIEDKKRLSSLVVGSDDSWLTELDDDTFKDLIALRHSAVVG